MIGIQQHRAPVDEAYLAFWVEQMRNLVPVIVGAGVATAEELGMEALEQRMRDDWERTRALLGDVMALVAWATTGPE
jgi:hypothetical protein